MKLELLILSYLGIFVSNSYQMTLETSGSWILLKYSSVSYNKTFYLSTYLQATWMDAYQFCKSSGMQLATFETEAEYKEVYKTIVAQVPYIVRTVKSQLIYFGAGNTVLGAKTGWVWYDTGKPITYNLDWGTGQPNNAGGNQLCASFIYDGSTFGELLFNISIVYLIANNFHSIIGMNDYQCYGDAYISNFICQTFTGKTRGFKQG
jgi:hypothetical protein